MEELWSNPRVMRALGIAIMAAIIVVVKRIYYNRSTARAQKKHEQAKAQPKAQTVGRITKIPSELRAKGTKGERELAAQQVIEQGHSELAPLYKKQMEQNVLDFDYSTDDLQKQYVKELYQRCSAIVQSKEFAAVDYMEQGLTAIHKINFPDGKIGSMYLILLVAFGNKKLKDADIMAARKHDANIFLLFKKYYFEAMRDACRKINDPQVKLWAAHYWHARIILGTKDDEEKIMELYHDDYISDQKRDELLAECKVLRIEMEQNEIAIRNHLEAPQEFHMERSLSGNDIRNIEGTIEMLLDEADPTLIDDRLL